MRITDTATLSGGATPTGTITFNLYGPDNLTCAGAAIFTSTVLVNGNGTYPPRRSRPRLQAPTAGSPTTAVTRSNSVTENTCNAANENVVVAPLTAAIPTLSEGRMITLAAFLVVSGVAGIPSARDVVSTGSSARVATRRVSASRSSAHIREPLRQASLSHPVPPTRAPAARCAPSPPSISGHSPGAVPTRAAIGVALCRPRRRLTPTCRDGVLGPT